MASKVDRQIGGKRAEFHVMGELLKRGIVPYVPVVDVEGLDAVVKNASGKVLGIQIKSAGAAGSPSVRWFQVNKVEPRGDLFILGLEMPGGQPGDLWVFPAGIFDKYASRPAKGSPRDLDLDSGIRKYGMPLSDLLCGFRNRWELITQYERYEHLLQRPEDLGDVLAMKEGMDAPVEEALTFDEYHRRRAARVSSQLD